MVLALAPVSCGPRSGAVHRRARAEVPLKYEVDSSHRYVRLAAVVVIAFSVGMPLVNVAVFVAFDAFDGAAAGEAVAFLVGTVLYLPIHVWLVWGAARGRLPAGAGWLLAAEAGIILAAVPFAGDTWPRSFTPLAFAVLSVLRPPWSVAAFLALVLAPFPLIVVLGQQPRSAVSAATGVGSALGLYALMWTMNAIRRLQAARALLASEAVSVERLRIDDELRHTVGADLTAIVAAGERASRSVTHGRSDIDIQLRELVGASRRTLTRARRMIRGYQQVSLRAEVESAATLLRAAGIETTVVLPVGQLPDDAGREVRATLRAATEQLLLDGSARRCVLTVTHREGRLGLDVSSEAGAA